MIDRQTHRLGSLIVAVLVVLFLVVLISTQTLQTLAVVRRGDSEGTAMRQARELLELGRATVLQHPDRVEFAEIQIDLRSGYVGKINIDCRDETEDTSSLEEVASASSSTNESVADVARESQQSESASSLLAEQRNARESVKEDPMRRYYRVVASICRHAETKGNETAAEENQHVIVTTSIEGFD